MAILFYGALTWLLPVFVLGAAIEHAWVATAALFIAGLVMEMKYAAARERRKARVREEEEIRRLTLERLRNDDRTLTLTRHDYN